MADTPAVRSRWFWINLGALCVLAPAGTYWFGQHLELYFTEIVVVGGAFTLWALVQLIWNLIAKATRFDLWDTSRTALSSPAVTQLLIVAALLLISLWFTTSSLYLQLAGNKSGEFAVEVVRKSDRSPLISQTALNASHSVLGMPRFLSRERTPLECRIVRPVEYEPLDCELTPGRTTRISVPGSFKPKEYHLLRLVPGGALYRTLPQDTDQPVTQYALRINRGTDSIHLPDLRRQTVLFGASTDEMPLVLRLHDADGFERFLDTRLRAAGQDRDNASLTAAILSTSTRVLPGLYVKAGDELTLLITYTRTDEGRTESGTLDGFPLTYRVTADQVQTLWLPKL